MKKLTIGMCCFDDFDGVYFTVQAIRLFHPEVLGEVEFILVDNNPPSAHGKAVKNFTNWIRKTPVRYVPEGERKGTAVRDRIFELAETPYVLCLDCHVLLTPGSLRRLIDAFDAEEDQRGLLHGPLIYDNLTSISTHFSHVWRAGMWGIWASAWRCACGAVMQTAPEPAEGANRVVVLQTMTTPHRPLDVCEGCGCVLPTQVRWDCHEPVLRQHGLTCASEGEPFEIPAQGMGVFACRKDSWLGFNPRFRGFGGEECYIHEKFRQAGRKTMCLPFLKWVHRFGRPAGIPYKPVWEDRIFNYLVGHAELGLDPAPVAEHFKTIVPMANLERVVREALN